MLHHSAANHECMSYLMAEFWGDKDILWVVGLEVLVGRRGFVATWLTFMRVKGKAPSHMRQEKLRDAQSRRVDADSAEGNDKSVNTILLATKNSLLT
jgi:hypothetical protein